MGGVAILAPGVDLAVTHFQEHFSERMPAAFVYARINVEREGPFTGTRSQRVAERFTLIPAVPFPCAAEWQGLIATPRGRAATAPAPLIEPGRVPGDGAVVT